MNPCLCDLFRITEKRERFAKGLPVAFDMVRQRMPKSNPAVGILREHVILVPYQSKFVQNAQTFEKSVLAVPG